MDLAKEYYVGNKKKRLFVYEIFIQIDTNASFFAANV